MSSGKSVLSSLTPLIWISKLYGCLPFSFQEFDETFRVKKFLFGIIHGMTLVISSALYRIIVNLFHEQKFSGRPVYISSAILGGFSSLISYVFYVGNLKNIQRVYEENLEFSKLIKKNNFLKIVFWLMTGEIFLAESMSIGYYVLYSTTYPDTFILLEMIMEHYLRFVITLFHFQFANSVLLIFLVFNKINEEVSELSKSNLTLSFKKFDFKVRDLSNAMKLHGKACDSCGILNSCFGPTLALGSICMMLQVVLCCYVLVKNQLTVVMFLFWFCSYVVEEWFVLHACEKTVRESARTGVLVHNVMVHTKDPRLKEQLQQFSLQLIHRKIEFSACGLFPLNYTLIYSIAGAVTTYLVILLQMQPSSGSVEEKKCT